MKKRQKGIALLLTLISLVLLSMIGFGLTAISNSRSRTVQNLQNSHKAYYLARAGLSHAVELIQSDTGFGGTSQAITKNFTYEGKNYGSYSISVWAPGTNKNLYAKAWKVTCEAQVNGSHRTIVAWLNQDTFATFCYFTDREKSLSGSTVWFYQGDSVKGKIHTNSYFSISGTPSFYDKMTSANETDNYYKKSLKKYYLPGQSVYRPSTWTYRNGRWYYQRGGWTYTPGKWHTDRSKFYHPYNNYSYDYPKKGNSSCNFSFAGGADVVELPYNCNSIKENANVKFKKDIYLTFKNNGTVMIRDKYGRKVKDENNITVDTLATSNLIIHSTQNVYTQPYSVVKGKVTVCSDKNVNIKGNITYRDKSTDTLGLVAKDYVYIDTDRYRKRDIHIHAMILAMKKSFTVKNYSSGRPRGTIRLFGGIVQNIRGPVGTFYGSTPYTGYDKDYQYDEKLTFCPPPNFPVTGKLKILAIEDYGAQKYNY